jgi:hypothetical protein
MLASPTIGARIRVISWEFALACGLALGSSAGGCSGGKSGLVLGQPGSELTNSGESNAGGSPLAEAGAGSSGLAGGGSAGDEGAAEGGANANADPPWVVQTCSPKLSFMNTSQGQVFQAAAPDPEALVRRVIHDTCRTLYRKASEVRSVPQVSLLVDDSDGIAGTSPANASVKLSALYLQRVSDQGGDVAREIAGVLHFQFSFVYQNLVSDPSLQLDWLVRGIADYVRLSAKLTDLTGRVKGGNYDSDSKTTAFFLDWLSERNPDVVYQLNQRIGPDGSTWTRNAFVELTGSDVATLWSEYQASLP